MTAIDIDAIRKLADAATRGPWELVTDSCDCGGEYGCSHGTFPYALRLPEHRVSEQDRPCDPSDGFDSYRHKAEEFGDLTMETAEFIAAARTLVPALCDELEQTRAALTASRENAADLANENGRLVAENARLRQQRDDTLAELTDAGNEVDLLEAENKRLRAALIDVGKANGVTHVWDHREKDWVPIAQFAASKAEVPS